MIVETTYHIGELDYGVCSCCSKESHHVPIGDTRCIECIEMIEFETKMRASIELGEGYVSSTCEDFKNN
jgi:hypothetical protein